MATTKAKAKSKVKVKASASKARTKSKVKAAKPAKPSKDAATDDSPPVTKSYMAMTQRKWFRKKLEAMLAEIKSEAEKTADDLRHLEKGLADEFDRANNEFAFVVDLRENERTSKLQQKIHHALRLIDQGTYGYCDDCGDEIGIKRMTARPVATKCIDCKQFQEVQEHKIGNSSGNA